MESTNSIQLFTGYGLTGNQARILTALNQNNGCLTVKQISQTSNIARESIYNILLNLKEMGLIQKAITKPEKYCSIPLKRVLNLLREKKKEENHKLDVLTTLVLIDNKQKPEKNNHKNGPQFVLIPKNKQLANRITNAISNSKKSIKIITSWKRHAKALIVYKTAIATALSNGTKILVLVTEKSVEENVTEKMEVFNNHPNALVKSVDYSPNLIEVIVDGQEVFLITEPKSELVESSALWSNNQSLIAALTMCFDTCWDLHDSS